MTDKPIQLEAGRVYRAKRPRPCMVGFDRVFNDRMILRLGPSGVQYDSPTVKDGQHYPIISREQFEAWAGRDVTDETPVGFWAEYRK